MDPLLEEEIMAEESSSTNNPFTLVGGLLMDYGWPLLGFAVFCIWLWSKLQPKIDAWRQAREDAEYHKDPDRALARMEAVQRAREKQQQLLIEASQRALEAQAEREEKKRAENLERLQKYGASGGQALGGADGDYLPLSGGASTSSYRPPKKSKCGGGGCGR